MATNRRESRHEVRHSSAGGGRLFVLRLWKEPRDFEGKDPLWRGSISEIDGSNTRYFDRISGLSRIIGEATGAGSLFEETQ
jgi:hypothetical protein